MKRIKGFSLTAVIIIAAVVLVAAVVIYLLGKGGFGFGGGKGDGEGDAVMADATVASTQETTEATTVQEIVYIEITVSENKYLFNNKSYGTDELDSLIDAIKSPDKQLTVRITDERASDKAYKKLTSALKSEKITYMDIKDDSNEGGV